MCLAFVALNSSTNYPFFATFNRDEVFCRATAVAHWWKESPKILAGRDEERGGTWAGITRSGKVGMLTFVRTPRSGSGERSKRSRGQIVVDFLQTDAEPEEFIKKLREAGSEYLPYNVILGKIGSSFIHYSNLTDGVTVLGNRLHGLSNASIDTPWPKVVDGKRALAICLSSGSHQLNRVFRAMQDTGRYSDEALPNTGIPLRRERALSAAFIEDEDYGTRTTTIIRVNNEGVVEFIEKTHGRFAQKSSSVRFAWKLES